MTQVSMARSLTKEARSEMKRRSRRFGVSAALGVAILVMATSSFAQETPPAHSKPWYRSIGVGVFLETTYTQNFNQPDSSTNQFRVFDTKAGSLRFDVAEIVVEKKAAARGEAGFRVDALAGSSIPQVTAASWLFRDDATGKAHVYDLLQAYASYVAPIARGLKVDAGKFTTHMGDEVVEGPDGYNTNASHSLLFGWAVPFTHTGVRMTYPVSERLTAQALVVTGWDNVKDNNGSMSIGGQLLYSPLPTVAMALNVLSGPEKPQNDSDQRQTFDYWITWKTNERISLAANADYGNEAGDELDRGRVSWYGMAGYARISFTEHAALSMRLEVFRDPDGERTGMMQTIREVTLTPEWKIGKSLVVRSDLRYDHSDEPVFERHDRQSSGQTTVSLNVIYLLTRGR